MFLDLLTNILEQLIYVFYITFHCSEEIKKMCVCLCFHINLITLFSINLQFAYNEMIGEEEDKNPFCCRNKPIKCWRHYLKRVEIQSSDAVSPDHGVELQKYFRKNAMMLDSFRFNKLQGIFK